MSVSDDELAVRCSAALRRQAMSPILGLDGIGLSGRGGWLPR
jgi:hypothetical protein